MNSLMCIRDNSSHTQIIYYRWDMNQFNNMAFTGSECLIIYISTEISLRSKDAATPTNRQVSSELDLINLKESNLPADNG